MTNQFEWKGTNLVEYLRAVVNVHNTWLLHWASIDTNWLGGTVPEAANLLNLESCFGINNVYEYTNVVIPG